MADSTITLETGRKVIELTTEFGKVDVSIIPYDVFFLGQMMDVTTKLDAIQENLQGSDNNDFLKYYEKCKAADAEIRALINEFFDIDVCGALFPTSKISMFAISNGFPIWGNIFYSLIDHFDYSLESEKQKAQNRIRKYSEKYKRK